MSTAHSRVLYMSRNRTSYVSPVHSSAQTERLLTLRGRNPTESLRRLSIVEHRTGRGQSSDRFSQNAFDRPSARDLL